MSRYSSASIELSQKNEFPAFMTPENYDGCQKPDCEITCKMVGPDGYVDLRMYNEGQKFYIELNGPDMPAQIYELQAGDHEPELGEIEQLLNDIQMEIGTSTPMRPNPVRQKTAKSLHDNILHMLKEK